MSLPRLDCVVLRVGLLGVLASATGPALAAQERLDLPALLAELDSGAPSRAAAALARLTQSGAAAASAALEVSSVTWSLLPLKARRARVELFVSVAGAPEVPLALARLADVDELVQTRLLEFLGAQHLGDSALDERCSVLAELARCGDSPRVRSTALQSLLRIDAAPARAVLERLLQQAPSETALAAAGTLAGDPLWSARALKWLQAAAVESPARVDAEALTEFVTRRLPQLLQRLPAGGEGASERALFTALARHPHPPLAAAGFEALIQLAAGCASAGEAERAQRVLGAGAGVGFDDRRLLLQRARLALATGMLELAGASARELLDACPSSGDTHTRTLRASAWIVLGAAQVARGAPQDSAEAFDAADALLLQLAREGAAVRLLEAGAGELEILVLRGLASLHRLTAALAAGRSSEDTRALEHAREADLRLLELGLALARRASLEQRERSAAFDDLLFHDLGPWSLCFSARASSGAARERWLDLETALLQTLANVSRGALPGYVARPVFDERLADPLADPQRRSALERLRERRSSAINDAVSRRAIELDQKVQQGAADPAEMMQLFQVQQVLRKRQDDELASPPESLLRLRDASRAGLTMVERLRENGRAAAARRLAQQVVEDYQAQRDVLGEGQFELVLASAEKALGGVLMDQDEPAGAEEVLQRALERLRAFSRRLEDSGGEAARKAIDPAIADVLVSLAVNSNVKLRDPARALEYFEEAYALEQSDFMRVLLACYRARAGRLDEARSTLRATAIAPANYYNAACTYALLGDAALALDYLQRDFEQLRTSPGARARQRQWARTDPDLAALRGDPRFERLLAPELDTGADTAPGAQK